MRADPHSVRHSPWESAAKLLAVEQGIIYVTHEDPIGRSSSNYVVQVDLGPYGMAGQSEQLWFTPVEGTNYRVACLPFCVYGLAYGDLVEVDSQRSIVVRLIQRSGRRVLRVLITAEGELSGRTHEEIQGVTDQLGLASEWRKGRHGAIDVGVSDEAAEPLYSVIRPHLQAGRLYWEWAHAEPFRAASS